MLSALKNLKSKAKELVSTITHGQGVSKNIDKENCLPEKKCLKSILSLCKFWIYGEWCILSISASNKG